MQILLKRVVDGFAEYEAELTEDEYRRYMKLWETEKSITIPQFKKKRFRIWAMRYAPGGRQTQYAFTIREARPSYKLVPR